MMNIHNKAWGPCILQELPWRNNKTGRWLWNTGETQKYWQVWCLVTPPQFYDFFVLNRLLNIPAFGQLDRVILFGTFNCREYTDTCQNNEHPTDSSWFMWLYACKKRIWTRACSDATSKYFLPFCFDVWAPDGVSFFSHVGKYKKYQHLCPVWSYHCFLLTINLSWCSKSGSSTCAQARLEQAKVSNSSLMLCHSELWSVMDGVLWGWSHTSHNVREREFHFLPLEESEVSVTSWWMAFFFVYAACGIRWFHVVVRSLCSQCFGAMQQLAQSPITFTVW